MSPRTKKERKEKKKKKETYPQLILVSSPIVAKNELLKVVIVEFQRPFLVTDWLEETAHHRVTKSITKTFVKRKENYSELSSSFLIISVMLLLLIIIIILIIIIVVTFLEPEGSSCKFIGN